MTVRADVLGKLLILLSLSSAFVIGERPPPQAASPRVERLLAAGDLHFGLRESSVHAEQSLAAYRGALSIDPHSIAARTKLLRALLWICDAHPPSALRRANEALVVGRPLTDLANRPGRLLLCATYFRLSTLATDGALALQWLDLAEGQARAAAEGPAAFENGPSARSLAHAWLGRISLRRHRLGEGPGPAPEGLDRLRFAAGLRPRAAMVSQLLAVSYVEAGRPDLARKECLAVLKGPVPPEDRAVAGLLRQFCARKAGVSP